MYDLIRDSAFGQIIRYVTRQKYFQYIEERDSFQHPYLFPETDNHGEDDSNAIPHSHMHGDPPEQVSGACTGTEKAADTPEPNPIHRLIIQQSQHEVERSQSRVIQPCKTADGVTMVSWYTTDDPDNPQNWSRKKKAFVGFLIWVYSFAVYLGSTIYFGGFREIVMVFNVTVQTSNLGVSMYVLGFGLGTLFFAPLSEIPVVGRKPPYVITSIIFALLWIPISLTNNFATLIGLRFLAAFMGSPCLAIGGATFNDLYPLIKFPYGLVVWESTVILGPLLGPVVGSFSARAKDWHWPLWEMLWLSGPLCICLFFFLPETASPTILYFRSKRLRKRTGNSHAKSEAEIKQADFSGRRILYNALIKPAQLNILDPAILFSTTYMCVVYGTFYSFFESCPLVYSDIYLIEWGVDSLPFLGFLVGLTISAAVVVLYWHFYIVKPFSEEGNLALIQPEKGLVPALFLCFFLPIGLFIFGWTARRNIHWIVNVVGLSITVVGAFSIICSIQIHLAFSYPEYIASLFAAKNFAWSALAAGAVMFSRPLFINLSLGWGVSLLAFLNVCFCFVLYCIWVWSPKLRARSRFAV